MRFFALLAGFLAMVVLFAVGLGLNPRQVPSPLVGAPMPTLSAPLLDSRGGTFASTDMMGQVWVLNVWASWCAPCRAEMPLLAELAASAQVPVVGLAYKDKRPAAQNYLAAIGNPFTASAWDNEGNAGRQLGVYGVPETYVIDKAGVIRFKHDGALSAASLRETLLPMIERLKR